MKRFIVLLLSTYGVLTSFFCASAMPAAEQYRPDSTVYAGVKSYFLLKAALDTDPVDFENYQEALQFVHSLQQFSSKFGPTLPPNSSPNFEQAVLHALAGNVDEAMRSFEKLLPQGQGVPMENFATAVRQQLSNLAVLKQDYTSAITHQKAILEIAIRTNNSSLQAYTYLTLGSLNCSNGSFEEGERYLLRQALPALGRLKNKAGLMECYRVLAKAYYEHEQYSQSKWFYLQSLAVAKQLKNSTGIILAQLALGQFKFDLSDFDQAIVDWKAAESSAIHAHQLSLALQLKFKLSQAYQLLGQITLSDRYRQEFLQLKDILENPLP